MEDETEVTKSERNKVLALELAARDMTKNADKVVEAAEKFLVFLNK